MSLRTDLTDRTGPPSRRTPRHLHPPACCARYLKAFALVGDLP